MTVGDIITISGKKYHVAKMYVEGSAYLYLYRTTVDKSRGYTFDVGALAPGQPVLHRNVMEAYRAGAAEKQLVLAPSGAVDATLQDDYIPGASDHATSDQTRGNCDREGTHSGDTEHL